MRKTKVSKVWIPALILAVAMAGCGDPDKNSKASNPGDQFSPPTVITVTPLAGSVGVCPNTTPLVVSAVFSKAMNPATITAAGTFTLAGPGMTAVPGTVSYVVSTNTATFTPTAALGAGILYTATISTAATDLFGNALAAPFTWTFTTSPVCGPPPPGLGTACGFGILGATPVVSSTGNTIITNGNVGIFPAKSVTGFPPGLVNGGSIDLGTAISQQAQSDLTVAYNNALNAGGGPSVGTAITGDIGGQTLTPGIYIATTTLGITGDLTLSGNANGVWIFKVGSALTTAAGTTGGVPNSRVILIGGAQAKNVYWVIGTAATLGVSSIFEGNLMANATIALGTGARLDGRALDRSAAVTMDNNAVNVPSCP